MSYNVINKKNPALAKIATSLLNENEKEINEILKTKILYEMIYGFTPKLSYESGCNCMGNYCNFPVLHGFRFDGASIKDLNKIWKKKRVNK